MHFGAAPGGQRPASAPLLSALCFQCPPLTLSTGERAGPTSRRTPNAMPTERYRKCICKQVGLLFQAMFLSRRCEMLAALAQPIRVETFDALLSSRPLRVSRSEGMLHQFELVTFGSMFGREMVRWLGTER